MDFSVRATLTPALPRMKRRQYKNWARIQPLLNRRVSQPLRDVWRIETSSRSRPTPTRPANIAHLRNPTTIREASSALLPQRPQPPLTPILLASTARHWDHIIIPDPSAARPPTVTTRSQPMSMLVTPKHLGLNCWNYVVTHTPLASIARSIVSITTTECSTVPGQTRAAPSVAVSVVPSPLLSFAVSYMLSIRRSRQKRTHNRFKQAPHRSTCHSLNSPTWWWDSQWWDSQWWGNPWWGNPWWWHLNPWWLPPWWWVRQWWDSQWWDNLWCSSQWWVSQPQAHSY